MLFVSNHSRVAGKSSTILAPEQTTIIGVRASSGKSAETSGKPPRWTPPMPPVAKTFMPARCAIHMVEATVVAPFQPRATAIARSRVLNFLMSSRVAIDSLGPDSVPGAASLPARQWSQAWRLRREQFVPTAAPFRDSAVVGGRGRLRLIQGRRRVDSPRAPLQFQG